MKESKPLSTPMLRASEREADSEEDKKELPPRQATIYRAIVARGIYMAQDRSDVQYAVKELSRWMSKPTEVDRKLVKKVCKIFDWCTSDID